MRPCTPRCPASPPSTNAIRSPWAPGAPPRLAPARQWLDDCDVLFAVGTSLTATPYGQRFSRDKFLVHSVIADDEINKDTAADIGLVGDAKLTLAALIDAVRGLIGEQGREHRRARRASRTRRTLGSSSGCRTSPTTTARSRRTG